MASLIKNQIIKRLSKFVKNLSSNQINLSTLKGEGELSSINLDEKALEEVTELPTWLKIQKATCGRVFIKIPWTSLKTLPIQLQLDDVVIEIETCEQLRDLQSAENPGADPLLGKYGFTNRVIDGISLSITNLTFQIKAQGFKASIFLPSLDIYSTTPDGKQVETLTLTRLRNTARDHILLFKEISWPNARIEASAKDSPIPGTAIRLIVNSCRIRLAMKKSLQDSSLVTSRLMLHFDDLLSVVNDAQLNSALNTHKEITHLMKRASEQRKRIAGEKLTRLEQRQQQQQSSFQPRQPGAGMMNQGMGSMPNAGQVRDAFARYDILETSLHFNIKRFDLHIIADCESRTDRLVENGSIQMTIANISMDHYPYHEYGSSRTHWLNYNEIQSTNRQEWMTRVNDDWHEQCNSAKASAPSDESSVKLEKALRTNRIRLYESATVINIDDLVFYPVSLNNDKQQKRRRPLITSDKTYYQLPDSLGILNIQHSEYYYPLPYAFPVPNSDLFIQVMPVVVRLDLATLSWLDAFISTLSLTIDKSGILKSDQPSHDFEHVSFQFEAMLPRIVISSEIFSGAVLEVEQEKHKNHFHHDDSANPLNVDVLELNVSKVLLSNVRTERTSHRTQLEKHLELFEKSHFFQQTQWPFSRDSSSRRISPLFSKHAYETYLYKNPLSEKTSQLPEPAMSEEALHTYYTMTTNSLKKSAKFDIWHCHAENIYLDFTPSSVSASVRLAKQNMTDTLSVTGWAVLDERRKDGSSTSSLWANVLGVIEAPSMLKLSRKQYTFLMHLVDELGLFFDVLEQNRVQARQIKQTSSPSTDLNFTLCLTIPTSFTLAIIDGLQETIIQLPTAPPTSVPEPERETVLRDTLDAPVVIETIVTSTAKVESWRTENKNLGNKNFAPGSSAASSSYFSEHSDETSSQFDLSEDLDADLEGSLFAADFEPAQPQKAIRLDVEEDAWSITGKTNLSRTAIESANGVFVKLNQINVCITEDTGKEDAPIYVACSVKYLRIDEFSALKFESIKPKLFQSERPDEWNTDQVPPINIRVDLIKGDRVPPQVTLRMADRSLNMHAHALDVLLQNLEEIQTAEEKQAKKDRPIQLVPIDIHLTNVEMTLNLTDENSSTIVEAKPPLNVKIDYLNVLRQINGQVLIQKASGQGEAKDALPSPSKEIGQEVARQTESLRLENDRLRAELTSSQTEISVLRGERDSLMKTISKLDIELTQAEYRRASQQPQKPTRK